jgi:hypothetical protein
MSALAAVRRDWVVAIREGQRLGLSKGAASASAVAEFQRMASRLKPATFPSRGEASAEPMAVAFLSAAKAFALAAAFRREIFAPALYACAKALDDVLDELRSAEAQSSWMRQMGRDD